MFRSVRCKLGANLKRSTAIINGQSSSSLAPPVKYFLFTETRVTSIFYSFSTSTASDANLTSDSDSSSFVVSYLINSCGLSESDAITASKKVNFKTTTKHMDSVLTLLIKYGFTEPDISKLINSYPYILSSDPHKTLKPKFDFFNSRGLFTPELANFFSINPSILMYRFDKVIIPSYDFLKSIVQSDPNVIKLLKRNSWVLSTCYIKRMMVNLELLRNQGVPATNIPNYLINQPRTFAGDADSFKEIVGKVKDMGFDHFQTPFLRAIIVLKSMSEAIWRKKMDVYKKWGWSEDHILSAFRKNPLCMAASEKKIMAVMNFLVNEMGYDSSVVAQHPIVFNCSLKERIIPRCSVIRVLVSRGLIKENISLGVLSRMVDESFLEMFVKKYEQQVPELIKVYQGQMNYQELLQN